MTIAPQLAKTPPIVVLGDLMLDLYLSGNVGRISPEAPVPVLHHVAEREAVGGAGNVALNLTSVGVAARVVGLVGEDAAGKRMERRFAAAGVETYLVASDDRTTTTKTRILAGRHHQLLRIDREDTSPLGPGDEGRLLDCVEQALDRASAMIISDYAKGCLSTAVLSGAIALARAKGVRVLVDPKRLDFSAYAGADVIKPNMTELAKATGMDCKTPEAAAVAAQTLAAEVGCGILLTRSEHGIAYYSADGEATVDMPTHAREVSDVSGAGDTVIALFSAMLSSGASISRAMHVANVAAGVVVSKAGTATLDAAELDEALARDAHSFDGGGRVMSVDGLQTKRREWEKAGLTVGFTNGCFDLIHPGHIRMLHGSRRLCDKLIVGLNSDASVKRLKGPTRPVQGEEARAEVIAAISGVEAVVLFDEDTPIELIRTLEPDVLIKGADYTIDQIVGADVVLARGGRVETIQLVPGQSTSNLVKRSSPGNEGLKEKLPSEENM